MTPLVSPTLDSSSATAVIHSSILRKPRRRIAAPLLGLLAALTSPVAFAADGTWINSASNSPWGTTGNWLGGIVADGVDAVANFNTLDLTAARTVNLGGNRLVGSLLFGDTDPSNNWALANGTGGPWTITLASSTGAPTIQVTNQTATISAVLAGTQGFVKSGAGTLALTGANTLTGGIGLSQGALTFTTGALGANAVTFTGTSTLTWTGANTQDLSGQIAVNDGVTATLNTGTNAVAFASALQVGTLRTAAITKTGAGTLTLSAVNTFTGGTRVNGGRIVLAGGSNRLDAAGGVILGQGANSGALQLGDASGLSDQTIASLAAAGNGTANAVVGGSTQISTLTINNSAAVVYAGSLGGTGANENQLALTKSGAGALTLSGANTFAGSVNLTGGTLILTNASALGSGGKTITISGTANAPSLQLNTPGGLTLPAGFNFVTSNDNAAAPAIVGVAGNNVIEGTIILAGGGFGGTQTRIAANGGALTLNGAITPDGAATSARTLILDGSGTGTVNGVLSNNAGVNLALTKAGAGTWTVTNANTYTGNTTINAGTLIVPSILAAGTPQPLGVGTAAVSLGSANAAATLEYAGAADATLDRGITVAGTGGGAVRNSGGGVLTLSGAISKSGRPLTLTGGDIRVSGRITGAAANSDLIVSGAVVTLSNATNNYNGPTFVTGGGTLKNGVAQVIPNSSVLTLGEEVENTGGTYDLNGFNETIGGLVSAGTGAKVVTNSGASGTDTLTITGEGTFDGSINDGPTAKIGLTVNSSGTQILAGNNNYAGPTVVAAGTLVVRGSLSGTTSVRTTGGNLQLDHSDVINNSATVSLEGGTLNTGGFSEGNALTAGLGALTLTANSTLDFGIGTGSILHFSGIGAHEAGTLSITNWSGTSGQAGTAGADRLIFGGTAADFSTRYGQEDVFFNGLAGYATVQFEPNSFEIVAVPEPSSLAYLAGNILLVASLRPRRKRTAARSDSSHTGNP